MAHGLEGKHAHTCRKVIREWIMPNIRAGVKASDDGQYTDDTMFSLLVVDNLLTYGDINAAAYSQSIIDKFKTGTLRGLSRTCRAALTAYVNGEVSSIAPSTRSSNGAPMRMSPVAMLYHHDMALVAAKAAQCARVTHGHPISVASAVIAACAEALAARLSKDQPWSPSEFVGWILPHVKPVSETVYECLIQVPLWCTMTRDEAYACMLAVQTLCEYDSRLARKGISSFALSTALWALYCFLMHPGDFAATMCDTFWAGGDCDTVAAISCAISGAYNGAEAIPQCLTCVPHDNGTNDADYIRRKADELFQLHQRLFHAGVGAAAAASAAGASGAAAAAAASSSLSM